MKLLIITQKVDRTDPILGFFHRWIEEFAKHSEHVHVIGQQVGEHHFPRNITVHSLGKEEGAWRPVQVARLHRLLWKLRKEYDTVFVHMTPIWVVLGWKMWFLLRTPVYLWYEARGTRWPLRLALLFVRKVFSASIAGMPLSTSKSVVTGHGIDVPSSLIISQHREPLILTVGRITASKRLPLILEAFSAFPRAYHLRIAGMPITKADHALLHELHGYMQKLGIADRVVLQPAPPQDIGDLLDRAALFLHASVTSLDKALLEAMAHSCLVISCSEAARDVLPKECVSMPEGMAACAQNLLRLPEKEREEIRRTLREIIEKHHALRGLIRKLVEEMR